MVVLANVLGRHLVLSIQGYSITPEKAWEAHRTRRRSTHREVGGLKLAVSNFCPICLTATAGANHSLPDH